MQMVLGTMTFGGQVDKAGSARLVELFRERGHRQLDTAYVYNGGATETLLGELRDEGVIGDLPIADKANPWGSGGLTPASVTHQLETSLERLRADALDLFYLHAPDLDVPIEDTLAAVAEHHAAGRFAGNESYRARYWKDEYFDAIGRFADLSRRHDIEPAAAALRWLLHHSALSGGAADGVGEREHGIILGATSGAHLVANLDACERGALPDALVTVLDEGWDAVRPACIKYFRP